MALNSQPDSSILSTGDSKVVMGPLPLESLSTVVDDESPTQCYHFIPLDMKEQIHYMHAYEWHWGLAKDTLDLEAPSNIITLCPDMHAHLQARCWVLIPTRSAIDSIIDMSKHNYSWPDWHGDDCRRSSYPLNEDKLYEYELVPTGLDVPLHSQMFGSSHRYDASYDQLPHVVSRVHPYFVILHFNKMVSDWTFPLSRLPPRMTNKLTNSLVAIVSRWQTGIPASFLAPCSSRRSRSEASLDDDTDKTSPSKRQKRSDGSSPSKQQKRSDGSSKVPELTNGAACPEKSNDAKLRTTSRIKTMLFSDAPLPLLDVAHLPIEPVDIPTWLTAVQSAKSAPSEDKGKNVFNGEARGPTVNGEPRDPTFDAYRAEPCRDGQKLIADGVKFSRISLLSRELDTAYFSSHDWAWKKRCSQLWR
ncbi:uncharacterized protein LAESUDRAFT_723611 [Laetiporus sulphureus 93-53]|uniref:HNH nuclease domain-containing protein n=1 Tax=Laetiporus sulphureus 93-53 TaxID=1314785 RepID=A0A165FB59_9APHY|nr:uncharacterized protein LAESUDRAFT_723611 [Laetiporus sulphureus 93-53]KZT08702.1 hypothetical protein LAESUDRAFT_723611 [Laetiporus sulphureus 93-53]